jgi:hypothetical protein
LPRASQAEQPTKGTKSTSFAELQLSSNKWLKFDSLLINLFAKYSSPTHWQSHVIPNYFSAEMQQDSALGPEGDFGVVNWKDQVDSLARDICRNAITYNVILTVNSRGLSEISQF